MTSNINANNINGGYPVAGQANDSQGFRDNFTNIKNNLLAASAEITDLQNKVVLKSALLGTTTVNNDFAGTVLTGGTTAGFSETKYEFLDPRTGEVIIDFKLGDNQWVQTSGPIKLKFQNWPAPTVYSKLRVMINVVHINVPVDTITFPAEVTIGTSQVPMFDTATGVLTPLATGDYFFEFTTFDGGTTVTVEPLIIPGAMVGYTAIPGMQGNIATLQSNVTVLQSNVATLQSNVTSLQSDVITINSDVGLVASHVVAVEGNVAILQGNASTFQNFINTSLSSEDVVSGAAANVSIHTSYFTTGPSIGVPVNETFVTANVGGVLSGNVSYSYRVSALNAIGESFASTATSITTDANSSVNTVTVTWEEVAGATGYNMYGRTAGAEQLLATIVGGTTLTWVDDGSLTPTSALPTRDTTNPGTATLAAGTDGQLKAFIANGILSGDMVITVSNVGWNDTGTGTITFAATGQACTLQYINNKWFCIGNNGAAFA